jgi:hypothetical protein
MSKQELIAEEYLAKAMPWFVWIYENSTLTFDIFIIDIILILS